MARPTDPELDPALPYSDAMRALIGARFTAVWEALPVAIAGEDPAGVKQMRVASRRLRAAMDVAEGCFPKRWYRPLHEAAKQITTELGELRDRDVLLENLTAERAQSSSNEQPGIDLLIARIEKERERARANVLEFLSELERRGIVDDSQRRFGGPPPHQVEP